jgi:hypothetical protein
MHIKLPEKGEKGGSTRGTSIGFCSIYTVDICYILATSSDMCDACYSALLFALMHILTVCKGTKYV